MKLLILICNIHLLLSCTGRNAPLNEDKSKNTLDQIAHDTVQSISGKITSVFQDSEENYWYGNGQDGIYRFDGKTLLHFTTKSGLPDNRVESVQEDGHGNIFFQTSGGFCTFDGNKMNVVEPIESDDWKIGIGDLWFKTSQYDGKVYRYDGSSLHVLTLPTTSLGEKWISENPTGPSPYGIYCTYKDSRGNIWFGTAMAGACRFNGRSFDWIEEKDVNEFHYGPSNGVRSIIEDKDGYFWFNSAYRYKVLDQLDEEKNILYTREKSIGSLDGIEGSDMWEYSSIALDNNHHLWMVSYSNGVYEFDGTTVIHHLVQENDENVLLYHIYKDRKGDLWLGTHKNGTFKFNGKSFQQFNL
jgi:ligand-binding sensor domain-containing protein